MGFIVLPKGYQAVEYIESSGTQWIDTGRIVDVSKCVVEIDAMFLATTTNYIAGIFDGTYYYGIRPDSSTKLKWHWWGGSEALTFSYLNVRAKYKYVGADFYIDDVLKIDKSNTNANSLALALFGRRIKTGADSLCTARIYGATIDGDVFIPCYRKSDGVSGLYDKVNNVFLVNAGTGEFEAGEDVPCGCIFQPGIVGKTNVVEGSTLPDVFRQLVNYTMLYYKGDECTDLTGGFSGCTGYRSSGYSGSAPTVTKNADHIHITHSASNTLGSMLTANKIDLTDFARLAAYAYSNTSGNTYAWANASYISARSGSGLSGGGVSLSSNATFTGWKTLDLTSVTGEYYLGTEHYWYGVAQTNRLYCMALFNGDDYNTLCDLAGVSTFATVDALIADTNAISTILSKQNAVNFMANQCTGDFMAAFLASADCLSLLESSPYKNTIKNNEHWAKFLDLVA